MLTADDLAALRDRLPGDPDLAALFATLQARAMPVLATLPHIPPVKALLSRDGGFCPDDGAMLAFDPWSPQQHRCPQCGRDFGGERHYRNWARAQHLWLAERTAELALIGAITGDARLIARANELLRLTAALYFTLPNRDNVLGPTRLFFSTYLESLWITSWLAAAMILRESDTLDAEVSAAVDRVADEAAGIIASFNEGLSNRQTWHAAALIAIGVWFDDHDLVRDTVESPSGLLGHLAEGFGDDGLWYEGENYHLFALRGAMMGMHWARTGGFDLLDDPELRAHFRSALLAPARSALPDQTYPARRDARYGVSLALPASLDLWEIGRGWLGADPDIDGWLHTLYHIDTELPPADHADYWLHNAGRLVSTRPSRAELSWWAFTALLPPSPVPVSWTPASALMTGQGLAILRHGSTYASLECGAAIGGHGHPDRLHLTLHAAGVHWLPDQGTGSYVHPALAWYRSSLAHNAPMIGGKNCGGADGLLEAFDHQEAFAWSRGKAGDARRTVIAGSTYLVDVVDVRSTEEALIELPWHLQGEIEITSPGSWMASTHVHPFTTGAERFVLADQGPVAVTVRHGDRTLRVTWLIGSAEIHRMTAPGLPVAPAPRPFLLMRSHTTSVRWISVLDFASAESSDAITGVDLEGEAIVLHAATGPVRHEFTPAGVTISAGGHSTRLGGLVTSRTPRARANTADVTPPVEAFAPRIEKAPPLDGTLAGFDTSAPLELCEEHQYRRSETPYDPDAFTAQAFLNRDGDALYLAVAVSKPALIFRPGDAPPLLLDNESDDIHSDGIQLHWHAGGQRREYLVIPEAGGTIRVRPIGNNRQSPVAITGSWRSAPNGYLATLALRDPAIAPLESGARIRFDLLINEMQPGRERRAGQLVWGGSGGWVYLRGDRHEMREAGVVTLE